MIALLICAGVVYAFAFDGFNIETVTGGDVAAWLAAASSGNSGDPPPEGEAPECDCRSCACGDKVWKKKGKSWGWHKPCNGQTKVMPCPEGSNCPYNSHSGKKSDCSCSNHPDSGRRQTWKVCSDSNEDPCDGKCGRS